MRDEENYLKLIEAYKFRINILEETLKLQHESNEKIIQIYKEDIAFLREALMKDRRSPITANNVFTKEITMADNQSKNVEVEMNFRESVAGAAGKIQGNQNIYKASEQKQTLAEAAKEIQDLLYQLSQDNLTTGSVIETVHQEIERNPALRARLVSAFRAGGLEALKAIFNHPLFTIPAETIKGWLEVE